jgi:peptidoglycan DL-endopeptidase CwlO
VTSTRPARGTRRAAAVATATAGAVILTAFPAHPVTAPVVAARVAATAPGASAPAGRPVSELLVALQQLHRKAESASRAYRRTARELREQQQVTDKLERRLARARGRLEDERSKAGRIARARYRTGSPDLPPTVRVLLADDPMRALHHEHALRRAAARQQATVRGLASGERHRGAVAAQAREALQRQQRLAERKDRRRKVARDRLSEVEELLASLTPGQLAALRRLERNRNGGGAAQPPVTSAR